MRYGPVSWLLVNIISPSQEPILTHHAYNTKEHTIGITDNVQMHDVTTDNYYMPISSRTQLIPPLVLHICISELGQHWFR